MGRIHQRTRAVHFEGPFPAATRAQAATFAAQDEVTPPRMPNYASESARSGDPVEPSPDKVGFRVRRGLVRDQDSARQGFARPRPEDRPWSPAGPMDEWSPGRPGRLDGCRGRPSVQSRGGMNNFGLRDMNRPGAISVRRGDGVRNAADADAGRQPDPGPDGRHGPAGSDGGNPTLDRSRSRSSLTGRSAAIRVPGTSRRQPAAGHAPAARPGAAARGRDTEGHPAGCRRREGRVRRRSRRARASSSSPATRPAWPPTARPARRSDGRISRSSAT